MKYKHIISYTTHCTLILIGFLMFTSCLGLEGLLDDSDTDKPSTTTQSLTLSADKQEGTVSLPGLKAAIDNVVESISWLSATPQSYVSGSPVLQLSIAANTSTSSRSGTVTITDTKKNTVTLTVTQQGIKAGIDDIHNIYTDQPAYAPEK